jgi:hemerythrin-like domain-containing protein
VSAAYTDPLTWFLDCHERIRRFVGGLERMVELDDLADPRVPAAATQAARYFREGLTRHAADEDHSLAPRMRGAGAADDVRDALDGMTREHGEMDALLPALLADLDALGAGRPQSSTFRSEARVFSALLLRHIEVEERVIFPAMGCLTAADRTAMLGEMAARRA